jgi:MFS family permease
MVKPASSPWTVLALTTAIQVLVSGGALTPPVFAPEAAASMGVPTHLIGIYTSVVYLGAMLTSAPTGSLVTRYGAFRVSQGCLALVGLGLAGLALAAPVLAVAGALIIGLGYGPVTPASTHVLARTTPARRRGLVFSLKQTGVPMGGMAAGVVVPPLVLWIGWQGASLVVSAATILLLLLVQPWRAALDDDRRGDHPLRPSALVAPLALVWRQSDLRWLSLASFTFAAMQLSLSTFLVVYLVEVAGRDLITAGLIFSAAQAAGVAGRILWGWLADKVFGGRWMIALVAFGMGGGALGVATFDPSWPVAPLTLVSMLFGATALGWNGAWVAEISHRAPPGAAASATGGSLFFTYGGVVFGPVLFGLLASRPGGYALAFAVYAAAAVLGALLVLKVRPAAA